MLLKNCPACKCTRAYRYVLVDRGRVYDVVECPCGERHTLAVWQAGA